MPPNTKKCCEKPKRTTSVSTRKGRRSICNNCGADWVFENTPSLDKSEHDGTCRTPECYEKRPTPAVEDWEKKLDRIIYERHEQLRGRVGNPFLEKPLAIPDTCPKCSVNLKAFYTDCKNIFRSLLSSHDQQLRQRIVEAAENEKWKHECALNGSGTMDCDEAMHRQEIRESDEHNRSIDRLVAFITNLK